MTQGPLATVATSFEILDFLGNAPESTPSEIAEELEKPVSTIHGHLETLQNLGYLKNENGRYRISVRLLGLGAKSWKRNPLYVVGKPVVKQVARELGEQVSLSLNEGGEPVVICTEARNEAINWTSYLGQSLPVHGTAVGKLFLAFESDEIRERLLEQEIPQLTPHTIVDLDDVREELALIREERIAFSREEYRLGLMSASALVEYQQGPYGAITIAGPRRRFSQADFEDRIRDELLTAANMIEVNLRNRTFVQ